MLYFNADRCKMCAIWLIQCASVSTYFVIFNSIITKTAMATLSLSLSPALGDIANFFLKWQKAERSYQTEFLSQRGHNFFIIKEMAGSFRGKLMGIRKYSFDVDPPPLFLSLPLVHTAIYDREIFFYSRELQSRIAVVNSGRHRSERKRMSI